jgi:acetyl esterase/lipase
MRGLRTDATGLAAGRAPGQARPLGQIISFDAPAAGATTLDARVQARALALRLADHLVGAGLDLASPTAAERRNGTVRFACQQSETAAAELAARGVLVQARPGALRLTPQVAMSNATLDRGAAEVIDVIMPPGPYARPLISYPPPLARLAGQGGASPTLIRYGNEPDQFAHLWRPGTPGSVPVIALIHGGYWRRRYRLDVMNALARELRGLGAAVFNLEYRRLGTPGDDHPGTIQDVVSGLAQLPALARAEGLDLTRLVVAGHSAGGYLALWWARYSAQRHLAGQFVPPRLVVSLAGVCDLREAARLGLSNGAAQRLLRAAGGTSCLEPEHSPSCPAQLLMHGSADDSVPLALSLRYYCDAQLNAAPCELRTIPGADHFDLIDPSSAAGSEVVTRITQGCGLAGPGSRRPGAHPRSKRRDYGHA